MTINPRDSGPDDRRRTARDDIDRTDVDELRSRIAEETARDSTPTSADEVKELLLMESGADPADLKRPYLSSIPDTYTGRLTLFEWLDYALRRGGVGRTLEALEYYETIGWVSESVGSSLRDHVRAFQDVARTEGPSSFETTDHVVSLVYVARLASMT